MRQTSKGVAFDPDDDDETGRHAGDTILEEQEGASMTRICPACGALLEGSRQQCECGHSLSGEPTPPAKTTEFPTSFHGDGGTLFGIRLVNFFLSIITLGIYSFWGRVKVRKYIWSQVEFDGDRFAYHGTGGELLRGWLKVLLFFVLLLVQMAIWPFVLGESAGAAVGGLVFYGALFLAIPYALVASRRYRLSRTSFRGIRLSFRGRTKEFFRIYFSGGILTVITLGVYLPFFLTRMRRFFTQNTWFGNTRFEFDGEAREVFGPFLLSLLLTILTLGLYGFWFLALKERFYWSHTMLEGARFKSTIEGGRLLGLFLTNLLLILVTLGIASPWVVVRNLRYYLSCLSLHGAIDMSAIQQQAMAASATGEGLAAFLETDDVGMDLGL